MYSRLTIKKVYFIVVYPSSFKQRQIGVSRGNNRTHAILFWWTKEFHLFSGDFSRKKLFVSNYFLHDYLEKGLGYIFSSLHVRLNCRVSLWNWTIEPKPFEGFCFGAFSMNRTGLYLKLIETFNDAKNHVLIFRLICFSEHIYV